MKIFRLLLIAMSVVLISACTSGGSGGSGGGGTPPTCTAPSTTGSMQSQMLSSVNYERCMAGVTPALTACANLDDSAQAHSNWMTVNGMFHEEGNLGDPTYSPSQRAEIAGYIGWTTVGENIAYGQADVSAVMDAWMNSSGHKANILNVNYRHLGSAVAYSGSTPYWTQNFGAGGSC